MVAFWPDEAVSMGWHMEKTAPKSPWEQIVSFFPSELRQILESIAAPLRQEAIEIRLRLQQPLELNLRRGSLFISRSGGAVNDWRQGLIITSDDLLKTINSVTTGSLYALEDELANGYITLPGGHRVGFTGRAVLNDGKIRLIRNISSLNFRIAREIFGIATSVLPHLRNEKHLMKTMIIGPPASGKTTLLREICRELSRGQPESGHDGVHVGVVDERSEIAGSFQGLPQFNLGPKTDVLEGCSKRNGVYLLLRSMSPDVIITDEIGAPDDWLVLEDILNAGVSFIASAHAHNLEDAMRRPGLRRILDAGSVERIVVLSNRMGAGTLESIHSGLGVRDIQGSRVT